MMPYAADDCGRPVLFVSNMAMHTQNLHQDTRASLLITQPDFSGDPLRAARVTLLGAAAKAPAEEVRGLYLERHPNARYWQDYTDFEYRRLEVSSIYFIGGFGVMGWVPAEEYASAQPDPLAETAGEIILQMNAGHADGLLAMARRLTGEDATAASLTAVDRLGFHLRLQTGDGFHGRRMAFSSEVRNRDEAWRVLEEMLGEDNSADTRPK